MENQSRGEESRIEKEVRPQKGKAGEGEGYAGMFLLKHLRMFM